MNSELLIKKCQVLEKVIQKLSLIYKTSDDKKQKDYLETIIGSAIWLLPTSKELYKQISKKALAEVRNGKKWSQLTKEHIFPRKKAGRALLENWSHKDSLVDLYMKKYGQYNLVTSTENKELVKFQKEQVYNWKKAYQKVKIELIDMSIEQIKSEYKNTKFNTI